ncbi:MAG: hypothetical protein Q9198_003983 [Flavoplaca austrocitrina]
MASISSVKIPQTPSRRTPQNLPKSPNPKIEQLYNTQISRSVLEISNLGVSYLEVDHNYHSIEEFRRKVVKDRQISMTEIAAGIGAKDPQSAAFFYDQAKKMQALSSLCEVWEEQLFERRCELMLREVVAGRGLEGQPGGGPELGMDDWGAMNW